MLNLFIAHFFDPMPDGTQVMMGNWPLHLSLASNMYLDISEEQAVGELDRLFAGYRAFALRASQEMMLGAELNMRTTLIEPEPELLQLHFGLMDLVDALGGRFDQPQYTGFGYLPHVTAQADLSLAPGSRFLLDSMTVFTYDATIGKREALRTWHFA